MKAVPDSLSNSATFLLNRAARLVMDAHEQALLPLKLSTRDFNMLSLLAGDGPISQQVLAARYNVDRTTMTELVDGLADRDLLTRMENENDRRSNLLYITVKGKKVLAQAKRLSDREQKRFLSPLSESEWEQVRLQLGRLIEFHMQEI
jgi:DNA-binding MarR family transcriptional regulator